MLQIRRPPFALLILSTLLVQAGIGRTLDCVSPTVTYSPVTVDRGSTVTVIGDGFGDSCIDTGPPVPGDDRLGAPLTGIQISFVQDDDEVLVAVGDADDDYQFSVDIVVPASLHPGTMEIVATVAGHRVVDRTQSVITVTEAEVERIEMTVVEFGRFVSEPEPQRDTADTKIALWILALGGVLAGASALVVVRRRS